MKSRFLLPITLLVLISLGVHSCKEDLDRMQESSTSEEMLQGEGVTSRQDSSPTPLLDLQAFDDKVNADYEFPGRTVFEHLYYFQKTRSFSDYMPASVWEASAQERAEVEAFGAGMETYEDMLAYTLNYDYSAKFSAQETASLLSSVNHLDDHIQALIAKVDAGDFQSFGQIWFYLKTQETNILQDGSLSQKDKDLLLLYNSLLRNYLKYEYGRGEFTSQERGGVVCILGIRLKCWLKLVGVAVLKPIIGGGVGSLPVWILGIIQEILALFGESCQCGDTPPPAPPPCKRPDFINVDLQGCGLTQKVVTWGYGTYSGKFVWQLNEGVAPDYNNATVVETDEPWLHVTQTDASKDVFVSVNLKSCNEPDGGAPRQEFFNFYELTTDPGTMQVWSAAPQTNTAHTVIINSHHQYYIVGTALPKVNDGLATLSFQTTWHGEIQNNPALPTGTIEVWWKVYTYNGSQNPIYDASVTATVTPICATSPPLIDNIPVAVYLPY